MGRNTLSGVELDRLNLKAGGERYWTLPQFGFYELDDNGRVVYLHSGMTWDEALDKVGEYSVSPKDIGVVTKLYPKPYEEQLELFKNTS